MVQAAQVVPPGGYAGPPDRAERVSQLALDLVQGLMPPETAVEKNGFSYAEASTLLQNEMFKQLMQSLRTEWLDAGNAVTRAQLKAGAALEDAVNLLYGMVHGRGGGPDGKIVPGQIEAVKALARIAGIGGSGAINGSFGGAVGQSAAGIVAAPTFKLVIQLGENASKVIEGEADEGDEPAPKGAIALIDDEPDEDAE